MSHSYLKLNTNECFICGENKQKPYVNNKGERCTHKCDTRKLQGDGRWVWCPKCKSYLDCANE